MNILFLVSIVLFECAIVINSFPRPPYNETLSKILAHLAAGAYSSDPNPCIKKALSSAHRWRLLSHENQVCDVLESTCSFYTIVSDVHREIIIVFRGTKSHEQLLLEGWQSTQPGVEFYGIGKVWFGQPRVGCSKFAFKHDELVPHSYRVVNSRDIVPHLPPCSKKGIRPILNSQGKLTRACNPKVPSIAYHHGIEIWYPDGMEERNNKFIECLGEPRNEDIKCSDSLVFDLEDHKHFIFDHRNYFGQRLPTWGHAGCAVNVETTAQERVKLKLVKGNRATQSGSSRSESKEDGIRDIIHGATSLLRMVLDS